MGRQIEVVIGDTLFRGATSPARDQVEMLQIAAKSGLLPAINPNVTAMGMAASLASVDTMSLNRLKELCFNSGSIVRQSDNIPVGENLFQDEAHNYWYCWGRYCGKISALFGNSAAREKARKTIRSTLPRRLVFMATLRRCRATLPATGKVV
ncbi:hypothetical protein [Yersinia enterocolitica]|uniref:hypothetical protein n=1 Tax=Yersinia enterocolitica TaxID=630 RepID=UPI0021E7F671|nr:hypothetical protein [Yersinia enterocolitica]MCV3310446.1 hypothetical protein [Yersinia enterocolitica]UYJ87625.1 hypothetical protein N4228_11160 [Yersinia enterocolitica]UYJ91613.1 hypothetical protein N4225_11175 [Yersinia enterocolitica]UYK21135.1 hypothetical protein N4223_11150 [Yersinia enterocolitica]UYK25770.1 hypothetical protein N4222_14690 [Yersinia enterocolitica]